MRVTRVLSRRLLFVVPILAIVVVASGCSGAQSWSTTHSDTTNDIWNLQKLLFYLSAVVFIVVLGATVGFGIVFRERPGRQARQIHGHTRLEVIWTLIPVVIIAIIAVPTFNTIFASEKDPPKGALDVQAIGHQWWFEFRYPGLNVTTANELHIPEGQPILVALRSVDVIHSFWIPQLTGKTDMVPGHENKLWFTPDVGSARAEPYYGQCAEFCGISHANMRFRVFVHTKEDFDAWVKQAAADRVQPTGDAVQGEQAFLSAPCLGCHTVQGTVAQGKIGPNLTHVGSRTTIGAGIVPLNTENLIRWITNSSSLKPGSMMPPMGQSAGGTLSDDQIAQIANYLQSLK